MSFYVYLVSIDIYHSLIPISLVQQHFCYFNLNKTNIDEFVIINI